MKAESKFWERLIWTLFVLLIGICIGQYLRIKQVEPQLATAQSEIKASHTLLVKDLTDLDVRLKLIEKKVLGMRIGD